MNMNDALLVVGVALILAGGWTLIQSWRREGINPGGVSAYGGTPRSGGELSPEVRAAWEARIKAATHPDASPSAIPGDAQMFESLFAGLMCTRLDVDLFRETVEGQDAYPNGGPFMAGTIRVRPVLTLNGVQFADGSTLETFSIDVGNVLVRDMTAEAPFHV